jgi:hypothetical protein
LAFIFFKQASNIRLPSVDSRRYAAMRRFSSGQFGFIPSASLRRGHDPAKLQNFTARIIAAMPRTNANGCD